MAGLKHVPRRTLRSSSDIKLEVPLVNGTFQDSAVAVLIIYQQILEIVTILILRWKVRTHLTALADTRLVG